MQVSSRPSRWHKIDISRQVCASKPYVKTCTVCQQVKINKHELVKPDSFPQELIHFKTIHINLVRPVRESERCKSLLKMIGHATLYPVSVPLWSTGAAEVWHAFQDHWVGSFCVPPLPPLIGKTMWDLYQAPDNTSLQPEAFGLLTTFSSKANSSLLAARDESRLFEG